MVGARTTTTTDHMSYIRKIRKPMVEKKRRERMNNSIAQLKTLIAKTIEQNTVPMTRVDKADILELTVYHLTQLQQQQQSVALAKEAAAYNAGYWSCAQETVSYLSSTGMTSAAVTGSLGNHLHGKMLQQRITHRSRDHFQHSHCARRQMNRLSTPLRPRDSFNSPLPEMNFFAVSPIQDGDRSSWELTSSFSYTSLSSSSSVDFSSSYSSSCDSSTGSDQSNRYCNSDVRKVQEEAEDDKSTEVVTIGDGKENQIGHMIKEVPWRPF